jgi:hypothetical protein
MNQPWSAGLDASPMFEPLRAAASGFDGGRWPQCADLNRALAMRAEPLLNAGGQGLRFVEPEARRARFEDRYEPRIYLRGEVQFRARNWHDLLNAFAWLTFPRTKAALNARHYVELVRQRAAGAVNRGRVQDALTLFDEGGVMVAVSDAALAALLMDHQWKELFWRRRAQAGREIGFYLFGHALYEKALQPFAGVTGRGVIVGVARDFFAWPLARRLAELDAQVSARVADPACFTAPRELAPVPILGVPGWHAQNEREAYYDDAGYFRPAPASPQR